MKRTSIFVAILIEKDFYFPRPLKIKIIQGAQLSGLSPTGPEWKRPRIISLSENLSVAWKLGPFLSFQKLCGLEDRSRKGIKKYTKIT